MRETSDNESVKKTRLWTKDFTTITVGSVISMLGNSIANFAVGLLVLDYTKSTFLYALYLVLYTLPGVIVPTLAGPYIDKFSRKKTIYILDFMSAACFLCLAVIFGTDNFNYVVLVIGCIILGSISSIYNVAYESFYPMLISEGNYSKAYSISSTLSTMTALMVPVSAFLYNLIGIVPLFIINSVSFLAAAILETTINAKEDYVKKKEEIFGVKEYKKTFLEGVSYLRGEKGLVAITVYFTITMFACSASEALRLPYFKSGYSNGEYIYIIVMGTSIIGRMIAGGLHYKFQIPAKKKFLVAIIVYTLVSAYEGIALFLPIPIMAVGFFLYGTLGVTSYNIRISSTQSYVPDDKKGRFNGIFQMSSMVGMLIGQLLAGIAGEFFDVRYVVAGFLGVNLVAVYFVIYRNRQHIKPIYNRQA